MNVPTIEPAELALRLQRGDLHIIDVRTPAEFRAVHVDGARNVPLDQLDPANFAAGAASADGDTSPNADRQIVFICQAGSRGQQACEKLLRAGVTNVVNVAGGTQACVDNGLPVIRGQQTISLERQVRIAAGLLVLAGIALSFVHPLFLALSAFVGAGLAFSGLTNTCGMGMLLARMPWNQVDETPAAHAGSACSPRLVAKTSVDR